MRAASVKATVKEHLKGRKITAITAGVKHKKVRTTTKQVMVASAGVTLSAAGRRRLRSSQFDRASTALKVHKLTAIVTVSSGGKAIKTVTVTIREPKKKKKK